MNIRKSACFISILIAGIGFAVSHAFIIRAAQDSNSSEKKTSAGLISRWDGDATSGTAALDAKGGNNGAMLGGVTIVPGKVGSAFRFDGSSGRIKIEGRRPNRNFNFSTAGPFSLEASFRWNGGSSVNNIIRKSNYPVNGPGAGYWLRIGNQTLEFYVGETTGINGRARGIVTTQISPDTWYHAVATRDRSGNLRLYVNGELRGTVSAPNADTSSDAPFVIGAWDDRFGVTEYFSGIIDAVSIYTRALGQPEVKSAYLESGLLYPIPELGNCQNKEECANYCDKSDDLAVVKACVAFAEKYDLISKEDLTIIKKLLDLGYTSGPGKCRDQKQCEAYCEDTAHMDECLDFAERLGLLPPDELIEARKVADALRAGAKLPGGCKDKAACEIYCEDLGHLAECIDFAEKAGFLTGNDLEIAKKMVKAGVTKTPGNCKGTVQCEAYCATPSHLGECADFGEKIGIMSKEEADAARKIAKSGVVKFPGDCKNKEACDAYCGEDAHFDECIDFALKAGMIKEEDAEFVRKTHGKTPGDCAKGARSPEEGKKACSAYCRKSENQQICMDFAVQIGLITDEDAKELGTGGSMEDFNACLQYIDPETLKCFDALDKDIFAKMKVGELPDDPSDLKKMLKEMKAVKACVNKKTDEAFANMPSEGLVCLEKEFGTNPIEKIKSGKISCREFAGTQERIQACFTEKLQAQIDTCLNMACADMPACLKKFDNSKKGGDSSQMDPAIKKKIEDRINICIADQITECLAKDCNEVTACIDKLQGEGNSSEKSGSNLDPDITAKITAKITGCMTQKKGGGGSPSDGGFTPPSGGGQGPQGRVCSVLTPRVCPPGQSTRQYKDAQGCDTQTECFPNATSGGTIPTPGGTSYEIPITPEICANFTSVPACSYVGQPDSQNYQLCKKCYPDR